MSKNSTCKKDIIVAIVNLPPPVTGMTLATLRVLEMLSGSFEVKRFACKNPGLGVSSWRILKNMYFMLAPLFLFISRWRGASLVYLTGASKYFGLLITYYVTKTALMLGYKVVLHHHVFSYVNEYNRMAAKIFSIRSGVAHIFLCRGMAEKVQAMYGVNLKFVIYSNSYLVKDNGLSGIGTEEKNYISVGLISNLTPDKGLRAVDCLVDRLSFQNVCARVLLAGPVAKGNALSLLNRIKSHDFVDYIGPAYGEKKEFFWNSVDILFFYSQYSAEADPLVIYEAISAGKIVVSSEIGCICENFGQWCLVSSSIDSAVELVVRLLSDDAFYKDQEEIAFRAKSEFIKRAEFERDRLCRFVRQELD